MSETEFASYADGSTLYVASDNVDDVIKILKMILFDYSDGFQITK